MAKTFSLTSKSYDGRYMKLECTQTSNGGELNTSTIKWVLSAIGGNSNYYSTGATTVIINGTTVYSKARTAWDTYTFPASKGSVSGEIIVSHTADGSKEINVSFSTAIWETDISTYSDTWELDSIPRYATFTKLEYSNLTENSITVKWDADANCDSVAYSVNGGEWVYPTPALTFQVNNLSANTDHNIRVAIKRADSQLWTYSNYYNFTTYDYPKPTKLLDFIIGDGALVTVYNPLGRYYTAEIINVDSNTVIGSNSGTYEGTIKIGANDDYIAEQYASIPNSQTGFYYAKVTYGNSVKTSLPGDAGYFVRPDECKPDFTDFNYYDTNTTVTDVTGNNQIIVKGLSTLAVEIPKANKMIPKHSATAKKYVASIDDLYNGNIPYSSTDDVSGELGVLTSAGTKTLRVRAYDSRGLSTSSYRDITVYEYDKPVINVEVTRLNNFEAQTTLKVSGSYSRLTIDGADKNALQKVQYRYRVVGGTWGEWTDLTTTITSGNFTCNDVILSLDNTEAFNIQVQAVDNFDDLTKSRVSAKVDIGQAIFFVSTNKKECYINGKRVLHDTIMVNEVGTDLNDYKTTGLYFFGTDYTPLNIPAGVNGWLEVIGSENDRIKQIWYRCGTVDSNDYMTYTRTYIEGTWGSWSRLATLTQDYINDRSHIADYIIEQGTDGVWTYEKWASGKAVCWCNTDEMTIEYSKLWGGVAHYDGVTYDLPTDLFKSAPHYATVNTLSGSGLLSNSINSITKSNISWYAMCHTNTPATYTVRFLIEAKGFWK